jgi:hypothetical protein
MSRTFLFLTLLFVTSYCVEKNSNSVNQIIDELVELNKSVRHNPAHIGKLIAQIRSSAHNSATAFNTFYRRVQSNCKAGNGYLKSFSNKLNGDATMAKNGLQKAGARIHRNKKAQAKMAKDLSKAKSGLRRASKRQVKEARSFRNHLLEAESKMTAIRHIRNIIVDELLNGKAPASLIQVNTISSKLQELKSMVEKDNDPIFVTVVSSLIQMASEKNLNDQKILRKFLRALSKLNKRLAAFRGSSLKNHNRLLKLNHINNQSRLKSIRALGRLMVEAVAAISGAKRAIGEFKNALGLIVRALKRKTTEAKHWNNLCKDQARIARLFRGAFKTIQVKTKTVGRALLGK